MGLVFTITRRENAGSETKIEGTVAWDSSYPTNGESFLAASLGLTQVNQLDLKSEAGYSFETDYANNKIKAFEGAAGTTGATSGGTPAAQPFIGTQPASAVNIATPKFSGTGQASSGQVITTTDNQTMTLNQCAGMWFVSATHGPYLIASNTAVIGAPAVLTVVGTAPTTDAGAYQILTGPTPAGTNGASAALATHTHSIGAGAGGEVPNATNLSALTAVDFTAYGKG